MLESEINNEKSENSLPRAAWILFIACVLTITGLSLLSPVLPSIVRELHGSPMEISMLYTSYNAMMAVAMLITGAVSTRLGIKKTLMLGIVFIGIFSTIAGLSNDILSIIACRSIWGVGNALFFATGFISIILLADKASTKAIVLYESAVGIGTALGPLIGGILGSFSWRFSLIGIGVLMIFVLILIFVGIPNIKEKDTDEYKRPSSLKEPFKAMKNRQIAVIGLGTLLYNFGFFSLIMYSPLIMDVSPLQLGIIFLLWGVLLALSSYFMAPVLKRKYGSIKAMRYLLFIFAILLAIMAIFTENTLIMSIAIIIAGSFVGNMNSLLSNAIMDSSPLKKSTTSASYNFIRFISCAVAPFATAMIGQYIAKNGPFIVAAIFMIVTIIVFYLNREYITVKTAE
ncbi:MAG: MFS transporter [Methanobrevibacter sp.]|jgi:predicted MFS family arabinose efflux permease|nr:MFS transporter [Methanobrevibacter sp.]